jgi:quercetin dioxygenase-like cupin family protein
MDEKVNEATVQRPQGDRVIDAPMVVNSLPLFIKQIRKEKSWKKNDRNAITVFKTNGMSIVLIALHKGAEMVKHIASGLITLQVLKGKITFNAAEKLIKLGKGQMLVLHEGISHSVLAKKKSIFLLTLRSELMEK